MKVLIQGKHFQITEPLRAYAESRLVAPLTRLFDDPATELRIELGKTNGPKGGNDKECHVTLRMAGLGTVQIEEATPDLYASIDAAAARTVRSAKRELERVREKARHPHHLGGAQKDGVASPGLDAWAGRKFARTRGRAILGLETGEEVSGRILSAAEAEQLGEGNEA